MTSHILYIYIYVVYFSFLHHVIAKYVQMYVINQINNRKSDFAFIRVQRTNACSFPFNLFCCNCFKGCLHAVVHNCRTMQKISRSHNLDICHVIQVTSSTYFEPHH